MDELTSVNLRFHTTSRPAELVEQPGNEWMGLLQGRGLGRQPRSLGTGHLQCLYPAERRAQQGDRGSEETWNPVPPYDYGCIGQQGRDIQRD